MIPSTEIKEEQKSSSNQSNDTNSDIENFSSKTNEQLTSKNNQHKSFENEQKTMEKIAFIFPSNVSLAQESIEFSETYNNDNMDLKIEQYLQSQHKETISSFKRWYDDTILRFVTGYRHIAKSPNDYNKRLKETDNTFIEYLKFRKQTNMDNVLNIKHINNININEYLLGSYIYGQDKYGHPLFWDEGLKLQKTSDLTIHTNCGENGMDIVMAYVIKLVAEMKYATNKYYNLPTKIINNNNGRNIGIYRHCAIFDLSDFNAKKVLKDRKLHEYYTKKVSLIAPEMVHKVYVINAPWVFQKIWKILKAFLHPNTIEKTQILGKDYMNEMLKEIDINMIPVKFGGKGKWKPNVGGVPIEYPIQLNHLNE
eukprot:540607_1